jgi:hypothetical protein
MKIQEQEREAQAYWKLCRGSREPRVIKTMAKFLGLCTWDKEILGDNIPRIAPTDLIGAELGRKKRLCDDLLKVEDVFLRGQTKCGPRVFKI